MMKGDHGARAQSALAQVGRLSRRGWTQVPGAFDPSSMDPWSHRSAVVGLGVKADSTC